MFSARLVVNSRQTTIIVTKNYSPVTIFISESSSTRTSAPFTSLTRPRYPLYGPDLILMHLLTKASCPLPPRPPPPNLPPEFMYGPLGGSPPGDCKILAGDIKAPSRGSAVSIPILLLLTTDPPTRTQDCAFAQIKPECSRWWRSCIKHIPLCICSTGPCFPLHGPSMTLTISLVDTVLFLLYFADARRSIFYFISLSFTSTTSGLSGTPLRT